ncbi:MAG: DMT family transporter [Xanthomonadales bacterium]|nr:DMT family transporter [Xanthomonadales bacterium]
MHSVKQHSLQAIGLMLLGVFMLSTMDVGLKMLVENYGSMQVVFFRCAFSMPLFLVWMLATDRSLFRTAYPGGQLLRGVLGLIMLYSVGECFRELQLADAYAIFFAAPLLITLLSGPMLGEPAGMTRILAALVGFAGVLIVLQPSTGGWVSYGGLMALIAMVFYALTAVLLRRIGSRDRTMTIAFWFIFLVGTGAGLAALPNWQTVNFSRDWQWLVLIGVTGALGQILLTAAFRRASVAVVAPFDYVHMVWAVLYGYWFWSYLPDSRTWIGSGVVIASGLFVLFREHRAHRRLRAQLAQD